MPESHDNTTLATTEAILIDGANGVTSAPRAHFPSASVELIVSAAVIVTVVLLRTKMWARSVLVTVFLLLSAVPGLTHIFVLRADAPLNRSQLASAISTTLESLMTLAPWPASNAHVAREDDAFFPLGRYAFPSREVKPTKRLEIELRTGAIGSRCTEREGIIVCGSAE